MIVLSLVVSLAWGISTPLATDTFDQGHQALASTIGQPARPIDARYRFHPKDDTPEPLLILHQRSSSTLERLRSLLQDLTLKEESSQESDASSSANEADSGKFDRSFITVSPACRISQAVLLPGSIARITVLPYELFMVMFMDDPYAIPAGRIEITDFSESAKKVRNANGFHWGASWQEKISWWLKYDRGAFLNPFEIKDKASIVGPDEPGNKSEKIRPAPEEIDDLSIECGRLPAIKIKKPRNSLLTDCTSCLSPTIFTQCIQGRDACSPKRRFGKDWAEKAPLLKEKARSSNMDINSADRRMFSTTSSKPIFIYQKRMPAPNVLSIDCIKESVWIRRNLGC